MELTEVDKIALEKFFLDPYITFQQEIAEAFKGSTDSVEADRIARDIIIAAKVYQ
ncbi:MAG: hypothetical protein H8E12_15360 [Rhodobacteraceae bacterium]|nr:hypothetical protein [Paracoccaceae bacterium]